MRFVTLTKIVLAFGCIFFFLAISCQKTTSNPPPIIKDSTVIIDSTVIKDSTVYIDSCRTVASLKNGLLVYLQFNGNFADSSGNGNLTSALGGAVLDYDEHGNAGSAFKGTGNGERVVVTNNGSIKFDTAFSFSVNATINTPQVQTFVSFVNRVDGTGVSFGVNNNNFEVSDTTETCSDVISSSNSTRDTTTQVIQPQSWYNVIAIFHKGVLQYYINGALVGTKTSNRPGSPVPVCPNAQMIIGGWWDGDPQSINGKLDEVRLYNRVLTAKEIAALSKKFR